MTLNREELEREIVNYDKQKLITQCLKLFDSNVGLVRQLEGELVKRRECAEEALALQIRLSRLERRTLWEVLNERIQGRIDAIRFRRGGAVKLKV